MSEATKALYANGIPLVVLSALYLAVGVALLLPLWRGRSRASALDWAQSLLFPVIGCVAAVAGAHVLDEREAVGGLLWPVLAAIAVAALPPLVVLARWNERASGFGILSRARAAEERAELRERELEAIETISAGLAAAGDAESVARVLLDQIVDLLDVEFAGLALISERERVARGLLGRLEGEDFEYWKSTRIDLDAEPSGTASAFYEAAPVTVYDVEASPVVNREIAEAIGAKSAAFIPLVSNDRVIAVVSVATKYGLRLFTSEQLAPLRTVASEAVLALERAQAAIELAEALERERLIARISRQVRSELDLDAVLRVAVEETGQALGLARCLIALDGGPDVLPSAQWAAPGFAAIGDPRALPAVHHAFASRGTFAFADVDDEDFPLEAREALAAVSTRAALAAPIVVFDEVIGVLALHRGDRHVWSDAEIALAEAVAREAGLAIHTARLLRENELRLARQNALLKAAQVVTGELRLETVLQLLVDEVSSLLGADAADCYLFTASGRTLRCAAVHGLDPELVGFEFPADRGLAAAALASDRPAVAEEYDAFAAPVPHPAYDAFARALVAPMSWGGEKRGVLGIGVTESTRSFTEADSELLSAFAALAAVAIRNAEAFAQRERQAGIERGLSRIAALLGESLTVSATLEAIAHAAGEALGGDAAAVLVLASDGLEVRAAYEVGTELKSALGGAEGGAALAIEDASRSARSLFAPELASDERFPAEWRALVVEAGYEGLLVLPLDLPREPSAAAAVVFFEGRRELTDDDLALAAELAGGARGALERSELFEAEHRARGLAQQLARTGALFTGELEPAAVLDEVVEQAPLLLRADAACVRLREADELVVVAAVGRGADSVLASRVPVTARPSAAVMSTHDPVAIADVRDDPLVVEGEPLLAAGGYAAYLAAPLFGAEGDLQGVLAVLSRAPRTWREEEVEALGALAANASVAFASAELYQRMALERERSIAILSNVADGIVAVDREGEIVLWNAAAESITGVPSAEAVGRTVVQVLQRELEAAGHPPGGNRLVSIRRADQEVWLSLSEAVMRDPAGTIAGRVFAFRDISDERVVEEMRSDFVATVSHELRAPLTSIFGFAATLMREDVSFGEDEQRTFLGYIASEAERLTAIVDKLLSVARLEAGELQIQLTSVDVRTVVTEVVERVREETALNGHRFVVELPAEPVEMQTDVEKLKQVLANLIDNAVKFSPDGGTVTVGATRNGERVVLRVSDEGIGIPDVERTRIFDKFYRSATGATGSGGTGLGLFIVQGLMRVLGGSISVSSEQGTGSSFLIELPARTNVEAGAE